MVSKNPPGLPTTKPPFHDRRWVKVAVALAAIVGMPAAFTQFASDLWDWWPALPWSTGGGAPNSEITIDPPDGLVPLCTTVTGSAPATDGYELWIATYAPDKRYYLSPVEHRRGDEWEITTTFGSEQDRGMQFDVYAFYLNEEMSAFLRGIQAHSSDGEQEADWHLADLPPGVSDAPSQAFYRDTTNVEECPE